MAPEILFAKGYDYKVDVWALGALYFTLLTSMYVFNAESMKQLEQRVSRGDWAWPKEVKFSLQGLQFLQQTFQFDSKNRLNWDQIVHHSYLTMATVDAIPLQILYDESDGNSGTYKGDYLIINTKNPNVFEKVYQDASAKMMNQFEEQIDIHEKEIIDKANLPGAIAILKEREGAENPDNTVMQDKPSTSSSARPASQPQMPEPA